jgi:hypothetical protein
VNSNPIFFPHPAPSTHDSTAPPPHTSIYKKTTQTTPRTKTEASTSIHTQTTARKTTQTATRAKIKATNNRNKKNKCPDHTSHPSTHHDLHHSTGRQDRVIMVIGLCSGFVCCLLRGLFFVRWVLFCLG